MSDRQLIADLLSALEYHTEQTRPIEFSKVAIEAAREYLSKPEQEPVGRLESDPYEGHVFVPRIDGDWSMLGEDLYTAPPQRKPLTDEEIRHFWREATMKPKYTSEFVEDFARAIEAAHGIKE